MKKIQTTRILIGIAVVALFVATPTTAKEDSSHQYKNQSSQWQFTKVRRGGDRHRGGRHHGEHHNGQHHRRGDHHNGQHYRRGEHQHGGSHHSHGQHHRRDGHLHNWFYIENGSHHWRRHEHFNRHHSGLKIRFGVHL